MNTAEPRRGEFWPHVVESSPDIAYVFRPDGTLLDGNPAFCRMLRQPREALTGLKVTSHLDSQQLRFAERLLREIVERRQPERSTRTWSVPGCEQQTFEVIEVPVVSNGEVYAIAGIGRDIGQEVILERKLWDAEEESRAAVDFALRTSLGLVKGYVYALGQNDSPNEQHRERYVRIIEEEIDHLSKTIEDMLDMRRMEDGEYDLACEVVDLEQCIDLAMRQFEQEAERRQIELVRNLPEGLAPLYVPRDALLRVMVNLIQNAIHHTLHSGRIAVSVVNNEDYIEIAVTDNGVGIPESEVPFIFDKYYRGTGNAASPVQGVGLGLAICRILAEAMGGKIWAESRLGAGSVFRLVLPRHPFAMTDELSAPVPPASTTA